MHSFCPIEIAGSTCFCRRLRQAEPENRPVKECQDFCEQRAYVSEFANSQCEVSELQMSSKVVLGVSLRLTEVSSFGTLCF